MHVRNVECPICHAILAVPPGCRNCTVACSKCGHQFRLPKRFSVSENTITTWLDDGRPRDDDWDEEQDRQSQPASAPVATAPAPRGGRERINIARLDRGGVVLEFSAECLREPDFRLALPRKCLRCSSQRHLNAHVVVFAPQLRESFSLEQEHAVGELVLSHRQADALTGPELLHRLPQVPNVPPPGNLPMPFWICDLCTPGGSISGQIQVNPVTEQGWCRLYIKNLWRAEEFVVRAGGDGSHCLSELRNLVSVMRENPWDTLAESIQNRLRAWYRPKAGEHFLAYVPDRDHAYTEDGMSGLVVSNHRLIYHTQLRHREARAGDPIECSFVSDGSRSSLRICTQGWDIKHICVDGQGVDRLRRALLEGRYQATWK